MNRNKRKFFLIACSIALLLTVAVGGTVAYIIDKTSEVTNTFKPSEVKCQIIENAFDGKEKKENVFIKNTGDTDAFIRAAIIVTWKNEEGGSVYGTEYPKEGTDYTLSIGSGWTTGNDDGYYYYKDVVEVGEQTSYLIESCKLNDGVTPPSGYQLNVEILAQAIQSTGIANAENAKLAFYYAQLDN